MAQATSSGGAAARPAGRWQSALYGLGAGAGYLLARSLPGTFLLKVVSGTLAGVLVGLLPFYIARRRGHPAFAKKALTICAGCGALLGLILALPASIVLTVKAATRSE